MLYRGKEGTKRKDKEALKRVKKAATARKAERKAAKKASSCQSWSAFLVSIANTHCTANLLLVQSALANFPVPCSAIADSKLSQESGGLILCKFRPSLSADYLPKSSLHPSSAYPRSCMAGSQKANPGPGWRGINHNHNPFRPVLSIAWKLAWQESSKKYKKQRSFCCFLVRTGNLWGRPGSEIWTFDC